VARGFIMLSMQRSRFATFAWVVLYLNLAVILWGAYVRASGSGAGCGSHWPLCNGEVVPRSPSLETLVELTHRVTSGIALVAVLCLAVWAFIRFPRRHSVRWAASLALFFMLSEAAIGAGLVLLELVAENTSVARALFISIHLVNTFFLLAMLTLTAWWSSGHPRPRPGDQGLKGWLFALGLGGMLVLGVSGAVTALGGTLFPVTSLAEGLRQDLSRTSHLLIRLRFFHPWIAVTVSVYLIITAWLARTRPFSMWLSSLVVAQLAAGLLNLALHAPIWLQLVHLMLSDLIWIVLVLLATASLTQTEGHSPPQSSMIVPAQTYASH
jgi:heme A synthase